MLTETGLDLGGRTLHVYDTGPDDGRLAVFWHHGTPNSGAPPEPLFADADRLGLRWVSFDRPGYCGSTAQPGRDVAAVARDVAAVADELGLDRFAVMGHSGGGPHALACAALLGGRVTAVVSGSGLAPYGAAGLDWTAGMRPGLVAEHDAARRGRAALAEHAASAEDDPEMFTPADQAALGGDWSWLISVVRQALAGPPDGQLDDELATVAPWGFSPDQVTVPALFLHGGQDRMVPATHSEWLAGQIPGAELWLRPDDGHISVLQSAGLALEWIREQAD
jgi:pimeloyl-ACP methyl ester carboxylesterase